MIKQLLRRWRARWCFVRSSRCRRAGVGHRIVYHDAQLSGCTIEFSGRNNSLEIGAGTRAWGVTFRLVGEGLRCRIGSHCRLHGGLFVLEDRGSRLEIGAECTMYAPICVVHEGGLIEIGGDSMIAQGTDLRNGDGHSILDGASRERINPAKDIVLGHHVWVGTQCQVLKGVSVGSGAIVAARSVVTKSIPERCIAAGVPARVIRENVAWDRRRL